VKVLWLTNHVLPEHASALGRQPSNIGGWMPALADALAATGEIELGIATNASGHPWSRKRIRDKSFFSIPVPRGRIDYSDLPRVLVQGYRRVVDEFNPDIVHVHGTEYFHGLLTGRKQLQRPVVVSIQGIIDVCRKYYYGGIPFIDLVRSRSLRDWACFDGLFEQKLRMSRRARWEREIFRSNAAFIGRTQWDMAHTRRMNPAARYYTCQEMLRPPFYETDWKIEDVKRHAIYASSASYPLKGFHVLLKAISLLHRDFPDIQLCVPSAGIYHAVNGMRYFWKSIRSGGYARYLTKVIEKEGLRNHVRSLGVLDAPQVANELRKAHIFVLPSFIENSPISLAEAMCVGTPSVASYVGGVPSMASDGVSALCFTANDPEVLAEQIRRIFTSDHLARKLSCQAKIIGLKRHSKDTIVSNMLDIYRREIDVQNNQTSRMASGI
jgi:glycosyltransferase involved in cell wall biosynthesis